ncbi:peptidoglycan-binding protein [Streptomyces sp. NPDC021212]|uniref:peptidoglycan-binding protein n=1 Tax=Streptomyces sp. NPDC021212 TaxID=3365118 RepID=UPI0037A4EA38
MKGKDVKQIQCLLNHAYGYPLEIDGAFGPDTLKAVETMQKCAGIEADGQVGHRGQGSWLGRHHSGQGVRVIPYAPAARPGPASLRR